MSRDKHIYITKRPALVSLFIDVAGPILVVWSLYMAWYVPDNTLIVICAAIAVFGMLTNARYDTKKVTDDSSIIAAIVAGVPNDRLLTLAGKIAMYALERADQRAHGLGCDIMRSDGRRYVMFMAEREVFDQITGGAVGRDKPDLKVIH